jgi:metal-responsive CopG/Arc/MetJ family transcriptional regulator
MREREHMVPWSVQFPESLYVRLCSYSEEVGIKNKSEILRTALRFYLDHEDAEAEKIEKEGAA